MRDRSEPQGLFSFLFGELVNAIADARGKLLDEGWFGRRAAPPSQFDVSPLGWERPSFEELWAPRDPGERASPAAPDLGLDR